MKDPDPPCAEIGQAARRVHQPAPVGAVEPDGEGVQGEVAAREILRERGGLDAGQGARRAVGFTARGREIHPASVREEDRGGEEDGVLERPSSETLGERSGERGGTPFDDEIEVRALVGASEQEVPDQAAHGGDGKPERVALGAGGAEDLPVLPGSRSSSAATDRGSPAGAPGSRRTTPSGLPGPPTRRKGRSGPRRCRTSTSDAVAGATETSQRTAETGVRPRPRARARPSVSRDAAAHVLPMRPTTSRARWRSARRAAGATASPGGTTTRRRCIRPAARGSTCG